MSTKQKYVIGNVAYGYLYAQAFLETHLKSLLDPTNLPAVKSGQDYEPQFYLLTDKETLPQIEAHPNFHKLKTLVTTHVGLLEWSGPDRYAGRYSALNQLLGGVITRSLEEQAVCSVFAADSLFAKGFFPLILGRLKEGHDAVLGLPLRGAAEPMNPTLTHVKGALRAADLFSLTYSNLHPLWTHSHWNNPQFSKLPFCLLWNSGNGLLVRTYSVSPLLFTPYPEMFTAQGCADTELPRFCKNPYWAHDWTDAPIVGSEFLFCYYPPFTQDPASVIAVAQWSNCLAPVQREYLNERFYFPSRQRAVITGSQEGKSDDIIAEITSCWKKNNPPPPLPLTPSTPEITEPATPGLST